MAGLCNLEPGYRHTSANGQLMTISAPVGFSEAEWENLALEQLAEPLGWRPLAGELIAPGTGERDTWDELLIRPRLLEALRTFNPTVPVEYLRQALAEIAAPKSMDAITEMEVEHGIEDARAEGIEVDRARLIEQGVILGWDEVLR